MADRYSSYRTTRQDVQIIRPPTLNARSVWQAAASFRPQRHPRITGIFFIWLFGLFAIFLSPSPVKITPEKLARYDQLVLQAQGDPKPRVYAEQRLWEASMQTEDAKVWFWRFRSPHSEIVQQKLAHQAKMQAVVTQMDRKRDATMAEAKSQLGLWSDAGIEESRTAFWKSFEAGKVFGRRQTFWDAVFAVVAGQERNAMGMLLKVVFSAMINFTVGMVCSIFVFIFKLPWILADYKPGWISGIAFFMVALTGAISVITAFLGALYGTGAVGIYTLVTLSNPNRLQGSQQRQGGYVRYRSD